MTDSWRRIVPTDSWPRRIVPMVASVRWIGQTGACPATGEAIRLRRQWEFGPTWPVLMALHWSAEVCS